MQVMWGNNVSIITTPPHGEIPWESHDTDPGGGRWRRGAGDICGVLLMRVEISGVTGGGVTRKGIQPGKTQRELHIHTLEVHNRYSIEGPNATPAVQPIRDAHAGG